MVVLSSSDLDSARVGGALPPRRSASGTGFNAGRSSTGTTVTSSSSTSRYSVPPTIGRVRITQSVDRDYTATSGSPSAAATTSWSSQTTNSHHRAASTSRSRGTSPAGLATQPSSSLYTPTVSVSSIAPPTYRRRYSLSSASTSTSRHGLDYHSVREIDNELDRRKSTSSTSRWSRRNDVVYTADGPRPGAAGYRDSDAAIRARSRSASRRRELITEDDDFRSNGYSGIGDVSTLTSTDHDETDDAVSRRVRMALARSSRSRSRAASLTRIETTATASAAAQTQINQLRAGGSTSVGSQYSPISARRASIAGFRASSLTRLPADVYYSSNNSATGSQTSHATGRRSVRFEGVDDASGWDLTSFVLTPGEKFVPTDVSVSVLPSGKKAVTYTRFSQDGHGDQSAANVEIERVIQRTKRMQESMHTLENFVKRNRSLFPEDIIIYQHIVFYLLDAAELKRLGMNPNQEVYGVKIRERLVAPYGTDVASILKRYYSRHTEVEVEYLEKEDIRRRLRQEMATGEAEEDAGTRKRRQYRTDVEETTETETETRRNRLRSKAPSVERRPRSTDRKLIANEDQLVQERTRLVEESGPQFTSRLQPRRVRTGNTIRLTCNVTGNPEPTVTWYRGNQEIVGNGRFNINNTFGLCTLKIIDARLEDTGVYTARAVNRIGEMSTSAELYVEVNEEFTVSREEATRKPWFLIDAQNTWAEVGQRAVIEAQATGRPLPKFKWQKDNVDVQLDLRVRSVSDELGNIKLVIRDVKPSDAGVYFCIAENSEGKAKSAATLRVVNPDDASSDRRNAYNSETGVDWEMNVTETWIRQLAAQANQDSQASKAPPRGRKPNFVEVPPTYINVNEGDPLTLRCTVDGDPRPVVTWYKGVRELTYSERHRVLAESDTQYMMQCKWTLQTDPGEYTIVASNVCGLAAFTLFVNVLPRLPQEIDFPSDRRKLASRDYELVKKMKQGKMAPVFIRKLPLEKTVKVGQTLVIRCSIEEAKMREYLADVDIIVKDKPAVDADLSAERSTRAPLITPDFIVTAADDVVNGVTPTANDFIQLDGDDVSVTVLKNVVHVTENKTDDDVVLSPSTSSEITSSEVQQPTPVPSEPTVEETTATIAADAPTFVDEVPKLADKPEIAESVEQTSADVQQLVAEDTTSQLPQEPTVEVKNIEQQQVPVLIPEVLVVPPDDEVTAIDESIEVGATETPGEVHPDVVEDSAVEPQSSEVITDKIVPDVSKSSQHEETVAADVTTGVEDVSKATEESAAKEAGAIADNITNDDQSTALLSSVSIPEASAESDGVVVGTTAVAAAVVTEEQKTDNVTQPLPDTEPAFEEEEEDDDDEQPEIEAAADDIPQQGVPATTPTTTSQPADTASVDETDRTVGTPQSEPVIIQSLESDQSKEEPKNADALVTGDANTSSKSEPLEVQLEPAKPTEIAAEGANLNSNTDELLVLQQNPADSSTELSNDLQNQVAAPVTADNDNNSAATAAAAQDASENATTEKKRKVKKVKKASDETAGDDAEAEKPKKKSTGKSKTKSKKKELETEAADTEQPEVEVPDEDAQ